MRDYNSITDFDILREAILGAGLAGGFLTETKKAFLKNNIRWPSGYVYDTSEVVKSIERDIGKVLAEFHMVCGS